jgi:calcineurin-like phosphoesterase family protein
MPSWRRTAAGWCCAIIPFRSWNGQGKGAIDLHGHSHGRMRPLPRQIDVGVDAWDFAPVALETLLERAGGRKASGG